jgi:hypothetical protein
MTRFGWLLLAALLLASPPLRAAETDTTPDFQEVYGLVRRHLAGATDATLNRAAVEGLLSRLGGKVTLVTGETAQPETAALVSKADVLEGDVGYVRVSRVAAGLAKNIRAALQPMSATNALKGVVLDLRFTDGEDYAAAAAVADLFLATARPLLDWGDGEAKSANKSDAFRLPAAVLVNQDTGGAAEALAAVMRATGAGLILGGTTAGRAMTTEEFPLKNGQRLRIATAPVKLGDGTALSPDGVKPDIEVVVSPDQERAYLEDAYAQLAKSNSPAGLGVSSTNELEGTNRPSRRPRPTEADLVRARRNGTSLDLDSTLARDAEPEKPLIRDPVLARAVDVLKGLAVVRQSRP